MPKKSGLLREIEKLRARRAKAQEKRDISEEAKICNTIGELYSEDGDYSRALHYHQCELSLSEASGDQLGAAIAHRRVGECHCELGQYSQALSHQTRHLEISRQLGNLVEEQRALATLGRTYFVHSQSELEHGSEEAMQLLRKASLEYRRSLDVCDKLFGQIPEKEVREMKSRLYLNLGLVYETRSDIREARKFMEEALRIGKDLGHSSTVFKCQFDLGSLHLKEQHPSLALGCFREALALAREKRNCQWEAEALREMGQAFAQTGDFESAKSSFKKVAAMTNPQFEESETEQMLQDLRSVRKILHYRAEVGRVDGVREKLALYDKLGDLCCGLRAFPSAIKFYGLQLSLAESHGLEPGELSTIYVSLARTHTDCGQFSQALLYYRKELDIWKGNIIEECDTWCSIAKVNMAAGHDSKIVMDAYRKAYTLAEKGGSAKRQISLCKAVLKHCKNCPDLRTWKGRLASLSSSHPHLDRETSSESEEESQTVDRSLSEPPPSSPSSESEDDDTPPLGTGSRGVTGLAVRRKPRLNNKRNEKGETLLHVAAIDGNAALVNQLAKEGAEVNVRDHCGWTPLHEACNHGYLEVVRILLDHNAAIDDPGGTHCGGVTPLIDAAINGHVEVVRMLVDRGADLSVRNSEGHTALSTVVEKLTTDPNSDLEHEHRAIRAILRGAGSEADSVKRSKFESLTRRGTSKPTSKKSTALSGGRSRLPDRSGASVLYSSDEEDTPSNPFEQFTVGSHTPGSSRSNRGSSNSFTGHKQTSPKSHTKGFFNPLGQVEVPALLPADEELEEVSPDTLSTDLTGLPVIDGWLVNDMARSPPTKRKRRSDPGLVSEGPVLNVVSSEGRRQGRLKKTTTGVKSTVGRVQKRCRQSNSPGALRGNSDMMEIDVDDEVQFGCDDVMFNDDFGAMVSTQPHTRTAFLHQSTQRTNPPTEHAQYTTPSTGPLRIRVRIESKSHLIPCPRRLQDGTETTIEWLVKQAVERYYAQEGVRPELTLTTLDGALLGLCDPIEHVLGPNEEVVGVVKQWLLPPLPERYQMACKSAQKQPHPKILSMFQSNPSPVTVDLSDHLLRSSHCSPLFQALQTQSSLTTLSLSGNRLTEEGVGQLTASLAGHTGLHVLDLSCTGITSQGVDVLARASSSSCPHHWSGLRSLNLSYNSLGVACGFSLGRLLDRVSSLQELSLEHCGLSQLTLQPSSGFLEYVQNLSSLQSLSVAGNSLFTDGVSHLLRSLPQRVTRLNLSGTTKQSIVPALQQAMEGVLNSLEVLDISHCCITNVCLPSLITILEGCTGLKELCLAGNILSGNNLEPLCRYLSESLLTPHLQALDLSGNSSLGRDGLEQLLHAFTQRKSTSLAHNSLKLSLCGCGIESPLPKVSNGTHLVIVTNSLVFLKAKQSCTNKYVVMVELYGNCLCRTELDSWGFLF